ncbi:hypothetical protein PUN4_50091 [Paraburkholderia unamae]|nr:hypothetical protein PUN4_50091 [Paraburkholderia unamae]
MLSAASTASESVDTAIAAIRKDGTYDPLQKKYFDYDIDKRVRSSLII